MKELKIILELIYYIFYFMIISYTLYYVFTGLCVVFNKKNKIKRYKEKTRFAILIPARNEEVVIKQLISSLKKQNYSKELYDIFVIPNNCTDNTKQIAKDEGANIIECDVEVTKKGDALKYSFNYLMNEFPEYDAYCIFDADNIVHPDFLKRMNDAYISGYNVAQGFRDCKNPKDSWISSCYSLFYFIQNFFFSQARTNIGLSASINGTGFMVAKSVIKKYGFDTITLTEDVEFSAQCALNGVKIGFVKDAITYDEQPAKFAQSWKQRKRWSVGTMQCLKIYSGKLFKESIKKKKFVCFDMSIYYMAPIMQILSFGLILAVLLYGVCGIQILGGATNIANILASVIFGYLASIFVAVFALLAQGKSVRQSIVGIITFPIFFFTWVPINLICLVKKQYVWEPIEHKRTIAIENVINTK